MRTYQNSVVYGDVDNLNENKAKNLVGYRTVFGLMMFVLGLGSLFLWLGHISSIKTASPNMRTSSRYRVDKVEVSFGEKGMGKLEAAGYNIEMGMNKKSGNDTYSDNEKKSLEDVKGQILKTEEGLQMGPKPEKMDAMLEKIETSAASDGILTQHGRLKQSDEPKHRDEIDAAHIQTALPAVYSTKWKLDGSYRIPEGVTQIVVNAYGAAGGSASIIAKGGLGGAIQCTISVIPNTMYYVFIGKSGGISGGAYGGFHGNGRGAAGGGATTISLNQDPTDFNNRVVVAGGGGGGGFGSLLGNGGAGGAGGVGSGNGGSGLGCGGGSGASQKVGGNFGKCVSYVGIAGQFGRGGDGFYLGGSGGGGYYGGGGGGSGGGGGGSSWCVSSPNVAVPTATNDNQPNGMVMISITCQAGYYCPTSSTQIACPAGFYCPLGSAGPQSCPAGYYCPTSSTQIACPAGFYCPLGSAGPQTCPAGQYSNAGASSCTPCGTANGHWTGGPLKSQCTCVIGWSGTDCDHNGCSDTLPGYSLGALLLMADTHLRQYSSNYNASNTDQMKSVQNYLKIFLETSIDINGDGNLTVTEVTNALIYRSIWAPGMDKLPLWCSESFPCPHDNPKYLVVIETNKLYRDAMDNFQSSPKHIFDGCGIPFVKSLSSTYPKASWTDSECAANSGANASNYKPIMTTWTYAGNVPTITSVCGYVNGLINPKFKGTDETFTSFTDKDKVAISTIPISQYLYKRVYCISVDYITSSGSLATSYECSVGLLYDGTPIDLQPVLTMDGVVFSYLDTSTSESEFDIFVGPLDSKPSAKSLAVGINYPSSGCGRTSQHISFADKLNKNSVGIVKEYSIRAVQSIKGTASTSGYSTMPYRIPFLVEVSGTVQTQAGVGVFNVSVMYCHINHDTAQNEEDVNFCPLQTYHTDRLGQFSGEIRVSDVKFDNQVEYFNITASLSETLGDGTVIHHVFSPAYQVMALTHLRTSSVKITDNTSVSINGSVIFDPNLVNQNNCSFAGVPVNMVTRNGATSSTTSGLDGSFTFSVTRGDTVTVYIPEYNNYTWDSDVTTVATKSISTSTRRLGEQGMARLEFSHELPDGHQLNGAPASTIGEDDVSKVGIIQSGQSSKPTTIPSVSPSTLLSAPPLTTPSAKPSVSPITNPYVSPSVTPSAPTTSPSIHILNVSVPQMLHRWSFSEVFPSIQPVNALAHDDVGNSDAVLYNGVTISGGKAVFKYKGSGAVVPYIKLPFASLNDYKVFTIETWVMYEASNNANATLFSFGSPMPIPENNKLYSLVTVDVSFKSGYNGKYVSEYLAIVFNRDQGYVKEYVNGELVGQTVLSQSVTLSTSNYIGRNALGTGPGLTAAIDEYRIWYGELSPSTIFKNNIIGVDPSHVTLTSAQTIANIFLTFKSISTQTINVGFYGGVALYPMFGPETKFSISAADSQCGFHTTLSLNRATSSFTASLAAMNYVITLSPQSDPPQPLFSSGTCDPSNPSVTNCFCDTASKRPYKYLADANQLSQNVSIPEVNDSTVFVNFIYHSGVCAEVFGSSNFATEKDVQSSTKQACFTSTSTVLTTGQILPLKVVLFERYPASGSTWFSKQNEPIPLDIDAIVVDFNVNNANVMIADVVSGNPSLQTFPYNSMQVVPNNTISFVPVPVGLVYNITAGDPLPTPPFYLPFSVTAKRTDDSSMATMTWVIPVLGTLNKEVPNLYPIASDPTLIFMVLRDPPGGASFATFHSGTTLDFALSINGLQAYDKVQNMDTHFEAGIEVNLKAEMAPFGLGVEENLIHTHATVDGLNNAARDIKTTRLSNTQYEYSISFGYDISTSRDPFLAGHASDVIIGGGVDLVVSEAMQVALTKSPPSGKQCVYMYDTYVWHPAHTTTYVLPVYEIEQTVDKLETIIANMNFAPLNQSSKDISTTIHQLQNQSQNWQKVLQNYRSYNTNPTAMFSAEAMQFSKMVQAFREWRSGSMADKDFLTVLDSDHHHSLVFDNSYQQVHQTCGNVIPSYRNVYVSAICDDFSNNIWKDFASAIYGACDFPVIESEFKTTSPLSQSVLVQKLCQQRPAAFPWNMPGNNLDSTGEDSIFGFVNDKTKYLTFGSGSPFTMSWTTSIKDTLTQEVDLDIDDKAVWSIGTVLEFLPVVAFFHFDTHGGRENGYSVTLGKSSDTSHTYERTVSVTFQDDDIGDYFAVRITEDPVFGTPIFTTMGGQSKCPGETGTARRESSVKIHQIVDRCCTANPSVAGNQNNCLCQGLPDQTAAVLGVVIHNLSPSGDSVDYTLRFSKTYDDYYGADWDPSKCGQPGVRYGLLTQFAESEFERIPFNRLIEIPVGFGGGDNGAGIVNLCETFTDIELQIIATCEISNYVYQYGIDSKTGAISYDPKLRLYAANDTAKFSLSWSSASRRRMLETASDVAVAELGKLRSEKSELKTDVTHELESKFGAVESNAKQELESMTRKLDSLEGVIKILVGQLTSDNRGLDDSRSVRNPTVQKSLWDQLHTESWLLDPESATHSLTQLGVETADDLALLDKAQLEQLSQLFKPIPQKKFLNVLF